MSRFLRVGIIADRVQDIIEAASILIEAIDSGGQLDRQRIRESACDIKSMAMDLKEFISRWDCEPLIYTGRGTTDEVINMLDQLIAKAESGAHSS